MFDRFYNTGSRSGFHWPGRIIAAENAVADWLRDRAEGRLGIVADTHFSSHNIVAEQDCPKIFISREPRSDDVVEAAHLLRAARPDAILALGGGATIDAAKAICALLRYGATDIRDRAREIRPPILVAAPTTAGSGSETSRFFILSDPASSVKTATRSWSIVPELTLLDPGLIAHSGSKRLLMGAFDAAIHLWETMIAKGERSAFTDGLAQSFLPRILRALPAILKDEPLAAAEALSLMQASAMAGIAISNVRTGMIHTLGESLAAQSDLAHPLTLKVFLRPVLESYASAVSDQADALWAMANTIAPWGAPWSLERFIGVWERAFEQTGLTSMIAARLKANPPLIEDLCMVAARDTTLAKENPAQVDAEEMRAIASRGLAAVNPR